MNDDLLEWLDCPCSSKVCLPRTAKAHIEAQAAEIEKLREALKHQGEPNAGWDDYRSVVYDAHAALEETK